MISAKVIADSVNPAGKRLTTVECTFPRWILAEVNTHRMLSRNSASSRAIPTNKILWNVLRDPTEPVAWGRNQAGMQARSDLSGWRRWLARRLFLLARFPAVIVAWLLSKVGLHKQVTNRIVEPWMWHTAIITATDWENLFLLRRHPDAQPEFHALADEIFQAMYNSKPRELAWGEWHLPYTDEKDDVIPHLVPLNWSMQYPIRALVSVARCARVSFVRQNEKREPAKDIDMAINTLKAGGHWSPFEHQAQAVEGADGGNLRGGWKQFRKFFVNESGQTDVTIPRANTPWKDHEGKPAHLRL